MSDNEMETSKTGTDWADALEALDKEVESDKGPLPPYIPVDKGQPGQETPMTFNNMQGMFSHFPIRLIG